MAADDGGQVAIRFSSLDNHHLADLKITMIEGSLSGDRHDRRIWSQQVF